MIVDLDGTSSIFVWGAQLEAGAFLTPYIPTVAASVTREADDSSAALTTQANVNEGTLYGSGTMDYNPTANSAIALINNGSSNERVQIYDSAGDNSVFQIRSGGVLQSASAIVDAMLPPWNGKIAGAYALNDVIHYTDGVASAHDTSSALPVTLDNIVIGNAVGNNYWNGNIAEVRYYDTRLDNETLEDMSNGIFPSEGRRTLARDLLFDLNPPLLRSLHD